MLPENPATPGADDPQESPVGLAAEGHNTGDVVYTLDRNADEPYVHPASSDDHLSRDAKLMGLRTDSISQHPQIPYDIEMYARYFLITLSDPSLNLPPSLMAGVAYTLGIMLSDFLVKEVLAEYPNWQSEQVYPFFTTLNLIFWYTVYFLLDSDEPINFDWIDDI